MLEISLLSKFLFIERFELYLSYYYYEKKLVSKGKLVSMTSFILFKMILTVYSSLLLLLL